MWFRLGIAALVALVLALPISIGAATANDYPVGRAEFSGAGFDGEAIVRRQLTAGQTHVMFRMSGFRSTQTVTWRIEGGAWCGSPSTSVLLTKPAPVSSNKVGTLMAVDSIPSTLNVVLNTAMMTFRVYDYTNNKLGTVLACGKLINQPNTGSEHWW